MGRNSCLWVRRNVARLLLIELLGTGLMKLLRMRGPLHVVWYHGTLELGLGIIEGRSRGGCIIRASQLWIGKGSDRVGTRRQVLVLGRVDRQGGVVHDCFTFSDG